LISAASVPSARSAACALLISLCSAALPGSGGLLKAFSDYEKKNEAAWRKAF
jgi:hypothetical protein